MLRVTQEDVARKARVHRTTVGLALRGHPRIPEKTRERVRRVCARLGYSPDPALTALAAYRGKKRPESFHAVLAWVTNWDTSDGWRRYSRYFSEIFEGASAEARLHGFRLEEFWLSEPGIGRARFNQILRARGITGLLFAPQQERAVELDFDLGGFSAVSTSLSVSKPCMHTLAPDQYRQARMAARQLLASGCRRIGLVYKRQDDENVERQVSSGVLGLLRDQRHGGKVPPLLLEENPTAGDVFPWVKRHRPDGIVTADYYRLDDFLKKEGLRCPMDIQLSSLTLTPGPWRKHSGIDQQPRLIGSEAIKVLVGMIYRNETGPLQHPTRTLIEGVWVRGQTTRLPGCKKKRISAASFRQ
ncbi:MAG: LacI family DNA-binding transcriptional regulator [Verrucomicrobiota bacterium]